MNVRESGVARSRWSPVWWIALACLIPWPGARAEGSAQENLAAVAGARVNPVERFAREWEKKFSVKDYEPTDPLARALHDYFQKLFSALGAAATADRRDIARVVAQARAEMVADTGHIIETFVSGGYDRTDAEDYFDRLFPRLQVEIARAFLIENAGTGGGLMREDSSTSDALLLKAEELRYEKRDYVGALKALEDALRFAPSNVRMILDRALTLQKIGHLAEARQNFELARELYPKVVNIFIGLGDVRVAAQDYYGAIEAATTAIYLQSVAPRAYTVRGHAKLGLEDYQGAIDDYGMQIASGEDFALELVLNRRAAAHFELGNIELALRDAEASLRVNPNYVPAHAMLGRVQRRLGKLGAALMAYNRALELRPAYVPGLSGRAWVRFDLGQDELALADIGRLIELDQDRAFYRYVRACMFELLGRLEAAESECREAIKLAQASRDPTSWHYAQFQLDILLRRQGRADPTYLEDVLEWPDDWAKRVAMHLAGRITAESLLAASRQAPSRARRKVQECEAHYYAGMLLLLEGRRDEAAVLLKVAADPKYEGNVEQTFAERRVREISLAGAGR